MERLRRTMRAAFPDRANARIFNARVGKKYLQ
jgi:hypothetical protein